MSTQSVWSSRLGFILASASSAVGLGAIWKFPFWAGTNGGAAFIIPFLLFTFTIGIVLVMAEFAIGRAGRGSAVSALKKVGGKWYGLFGGLAVLNAYIILSYYSVVGGWCVAYLLDALRMNVVSGDAQQLTSHFGALIADGTSNVFYMFIFLTLTATVVAMGVEKGIENIAKFLMPLLFLLMLFIIVRCLMMPGAMDGLKFMFAFNWEQVTMQSILNAMGFTFFSLSLGCAILVTYGSYLTDSTDIPGSSMWVAVLATQAALLGGVMILPAVFAFGMDPAAGPSLVFLTVPRVFSQIPMGEYLAMAFYVCLGIAAITSSVSLFEGVVAYLINSWHLTRHAASSLCWGTLFIFGSVQALSFGPWAEVKIAGMSIFDFTDYVCTNVFMPIGGLSIAVLAGWLAWPTVKAELVRAVPHKEGTLKMIRFSVAVLAPCLVGIVLWSGLR